MNIKSHIPKPLLFSKLKLLVLGLFTVLSIIFIKPITAYAGIEDEIADQVISECKYIRYQWIRVKIIATNQME